MTAALAAFVAAAAVLIAAATLLAKAADAIAEHTGIGRVWIGAVLLAAATSLPELATDISAVRLGAADLAAGDLFGSSMANMLILALLDLLPPRRRVLQGAAQDNLLAAALALSLNALAALFILARPRYGVGGFSPESLLLFMAYVAGSRAVYRQGQRDPAASAAVAPQAQPAGSLRRSTALFVVAAALILVTAPVFAGAAKQLAALSGLGNTFVGTMLVGLATSLPELVSCLAAVRMGSFDLAIGNLFGSNAFNMAIFFAMDLADPTTPVFATLDPAHALSALSAIVLMSVGVAAILYRAAGRLRFLEPNSGIMLAVYAASVWLLYRHSAGR